MSVNKLKKDTMQQKYAKNLTLSKNDLNKIKVKKEKNNPKLNKLYLDDIESLQKTTSIIEIEDTSFLNKKQNRNSNNKKNNQIQKGYQLRENNKQKKEPFNKIINCHHCNKIKLIEEMLTCVNENCRESYCLNCLKTVYHKVRISHYTAKWICYKCNSRCLCEKCKSSNSVFCSTKQNIKKKIKKKHLKRKRNSERIIKRAKIIKNGQGNEYIHISNNITVNNFCIIENHNTQDNNNNIHNQSTNDEYLEIIKKCEERYNILNEENFSIKCPLCQIDICSSNELLYFEKCDDLKKYIEAIKLVKNKVLIINENSENSQFNFDKPKVICKCCFMKVISFKNYISIIKHYLTKKEENPKREKDQKEIQQGGNSRNIFNSLFNNCNDNISNINNSNNNNNSNKNNNNSNKNNNNSNNNINNYSNKSTIIEQMNNSNSQIEQKEEKLPEEFQGEIYPLLIKPIYEEKLLYLNNKLNILIGIFNDMIGSIINDIRNRTFNEEKKKIFFNRHKQQIEEFLKIKKEYFDFFMDYLKKILNFNQMIISTQRGNHELIQTVNNEIHIFFQNLSFFWALLNIILIICGQTVNEKVKDYQC